ncbi:cation transporter [[Clostridium] innocuum]|nr:cation transporter [[Clostridium] innocuum]
MWKYTIEVNGMMCGMCEAHINDVIRNTFAVKKVNSSRGKKQTVILSETEIDVEALANAIRDTGYEVGKIQKEPYKKKRLFG